jgi:hypothetical protein
MDQQEGVVAFYCRPVPNILVPLLIGLTPSLQRGGRAVEVVDDKIVTQILENEANAFHVTCWFKYHVTANSTRLGYCACHGT